MENTLQKKSNDGIFFKFKKIISGMFSKTKDNTENRTKDNKEMITDTKKNKKDKKKKREKKLFNKIKKENKKNKDTKGLVQNEDDSNVIYDSRGFNSKGINKDTRTYFDKEGFDKNGYNFRGYNRDGYNREGFNIDGWNRNGINRETGTNYNKEGFDKNGYNKDGVHKDVIIKKEYFPEKIVETFNTAEQNSSESYLEDMSMEELIELEHRIDKEIEQTQVKIEKQRVIKRVKGKIEIAKRKELELQEIRQS